MRYAIAAMQRHLDAGHKTLPLVIPLLFYQGRRSPYPWSLNWLDDFSEPDAARQLYNHPFPLVDITIIPDEEIMQHRSMAALTLVQKHIRRRDLAQLQDKLAKLIIMGHMSGQQMTVLVNYLAQAGQSRDVQRLLYGLAQRVPQHGEKLMTLAEEMKLIGRRRAMQEVAKAMMARGFDRSIIMEITGLSANELQQLSQ